MALAAGAGVAVEADAALDPLGWFYGEDQGRYLLGCAPGDAAAVLEAAAAVGVPARRVGAVGGDAVALGPAAVALSDLRAAHEGGFARLMGERDA